MAQFEETQIMPTIYLAGPITGICDDERSGWRNSLKREFGSKFMFLDPLELDEGMIDSPAGERWRIIAECERRSILKSDGVLAYLPKEPSMGTAMGIMYGHMTHRVVVGVRDAGLPDLSPMVKYHLHDLKPTFAEALTSIESLLAKCSATGVRNRKGEIQHFDLARIEGAIQRAVAAARSSVSEPLSEIPPASKLAGAVTREIETRIETGELSAKDIDIERIQDLVEVVLMHNAHVPELHDVARAYIRYRALRTEQRQAGQRDDQTLQFVQDQILHTLKAKVGNILRNCGDGFDYSRQHRDTDLIELFQMIQDNAEHIKNSIEAARDQLRQRYQEDAVSLERIIKEIENDYLGRCHLNLDIKTSRLVRAVPFKLKSILDNIVDNAVKYGFRGQEKGTVYMRCWDADSGEVSLYVSNDGPPMSVTGASAKSASWGIGIQHIERLSAEMGAALRRSPASPEGGPSYTLVFPASRVSTDVAQGTIIVGDDDKSDRKNISQILRKNGFHVVEVGDPQGILSALSETPNLKGVILDVDFKAQKDGIWVLQEIRQSTPWRNLKVVVISGSSKPGWRDQAEHLEAHTLDKLSFRPRDLVQFFL